MLPEDTKRHKEATLDSALKTQQTVLGDHFGCHGSAGTPLGTHAIGQDSGLEESRKTIRT
jgi:hypothetical protein